MPNRFEVVEDDCTGCGLCSERAPDNLDIPAGSSTAAVFKQPQSPMEEEACLEASEYCPTGGLVVHSSPHPSVESLETGAQASFVPAGESMPAETPADWRNET